MKLLKVCLFVWLVLSLAACSPEGSSGAIDSSGSNVQSSGNAPSGAQPTGGGDDSDTDGSNVDTDNTGSEPDSEPDSETGSETNSETNSESDSETDSESDSTDNGDGVDNGDVDSSEIGNGDSASTNARPNILLIVTDDQGLDASAQYSLSNDLPNTPVINALAAQGITYDNAWATPSCTTTRAALLTGRHGVNSGVTQTPGVLSPGVGTIQSLLGSQAASSDYATAVFGKWHVAGGNPDPDHPAQLGVQHYAGNLAGNLSDYFNWDVTVNGTSVNSDTYHTTALTDFAIDWIAEQDTPWFAWVAFSAPHSPFHAPPEQFNTRGLSGTTEDINDNPRDYFLAAIETLDTELGRLLDSMDPVERARTLIIYVGDNGSPRPVIDRDAFIASHGKGSLFEGGIRVPLVVSGYGVTRSNERESALVHVVDLYPTIAELTGTASVTDRDGFSLLSGFTDSSSSQRDYNYTEFISDSALGSGWTVRNAQYKYLSYSDGSEALYDLFSDADETSSLLPGNVTIQAVASELRIAGQTIRGELPDNASDDAIDITNAVLANNSANCADHVAAYKALANDASTGVLYNVSLQVTTTTSHCVFTSNAIPNHTFNNGAAGFPNPVSEQESQYLVPLNPLAATSITPLSLQYDDAIMLNGVKVDLLAAGCFGIGNGKVGCGNPNQPWRYDPVFEASGFNTDQHNAHTQSNGAYHYHGNPNALFNDSGDTASPVIGFAADGFPIFGSYIDDAGSVRKVRSSYQLKSGSRPDSTGEPGGQYDGTFRDDYEYIAGSGDLDECNGMSTGGSYGYYVTDGYPHIIACFKGEVDESFRK